MPHKMKIRMVRSTERLGVDWGDDFEAVRLSEDRKTDIAGLSHRASAPLHGRPGGGDLDECLRDVEHYLDYHRPNDLYPLFLRGPTLVYERASRQLIAVCLMAGSPMTLFRRWHDV